MLSVNSACFLSAVEAGWGRMYWKRAEYTKLPDWEGGRTIDLGRMLREKSAISHLEK